jgi:hypothetical protein
MTRQEKAPPVATGEGFRKPILDGLSISRCAQIRVGFLAVQPNCFWRVKR